MTKQLTAKKSPKAYRTNLNRIPRFAGDFAAILKPGMVLALLGDLGTGKTTFVRELVKNLGFAGKVTSPSFTLVNRYKIGKGGIDYLYHIDLYRLANQPLDMDAGFGLSDLLHDQNSIVAIEWANKVIDLLPQDRLLVINFDNETKE